MRCPNDYSECTDRDQLTDAVNVVLFVLELFICQGCELAELESPSWLESVKQDQDFSAGFAILVNFAGRNAENLCTECSDVADGSGVNCLDEALVQS